MPKQFKILLEVEEAGLGPVMSTLNRTPGVIRFDLLMDTQSEQRALSRAKPNGHANGAAETPHKKKRKPRFVGKVSGADFLLKLLKKKPMNTPALKAAFEKGGRAGGSTASLLHNAKKGGLVVFADNTYALTEKGRTAAEKI